MFKLGLVFVMSGGIVNEFDVKGTKGLCSDAKKVVQVERQKNAFKRSNLWKQSVMICFLVLFIFFSGMFIGYNNGVSYATHHLLYRDLLNHIQPDVRESFLAADFTSICPVNTYFVFKECSTNFGLYSTKDLCFVCESKEVE